MLYEIHLIHACKNDVFKSTIILTTYLSNLVFIEFALTNVIQSKSSVFLEEIKTYLKNGTPPKVIDEFRVHKVTSLFLLYYSIIIV